MKRMRLPNGYGSITKLTGKRRNPYMVRVSGVLREDGTFKRQVLGYYKTRSEAYEELILYNKTPIDLNSSEYYTLEILIKKFVSEKENQIEEKTLNRYKTSIKHFDKYFEREIRDLKYDELQEILNRLPKSTGASCLVVLNYVYSEAIKLEIVSKNIASILKTSKYKTKQVERSIYSVEDIREIETIALSNENIFAEILFVLLYTWLRISEALEIKVENVYLDGRYFIAGKKTESGKNRIIPIHKKIENIIFKHHKLALEQETKYLFIYKNSNIKTDNYKYYFYKIINSLGKKYNIHSTRHTFITRMKELEINIFKLKRIIGHKSIDITDSIYTHYSIPSLIEVIDKLEY